MGRPNSAHAPEPADSLDHDPVWQAFLNAPVDPEPAPEAERLALADPSSQVFDESPSGEEIVRALEAARGDDAFRRSFVRKMLAERRSVTPRRPLR
jgi:hypothetical protein